MKEKKIFLSVMKTYLVLVMILLIVLIGCSFYSYQSFKSNTKNAQVALLNQVQHEMDIRLENISKISQLLADHPIVQEIAELEDEQPEYQLKYTELNQVLRNENTMQQSEAETVLYFKNSNAVFTGNYRYQDENLDAFLKKKGISEEEFQNLVSLERNKGAYQILKSGTKSAVLIHLNPILDKSYHRAGVVITFVSVREFEKILNLSDYIEQSICCMANGDRSLMIGTVPEGQDVLQQNSYEEIVCNSEPVMQEIQGKRYITMGISSQSGVWNYYFSIPMSIFYQQNRTYFIIIAGAVLRSLLAGVFLAWHYSKAFSEPIQEILDTFRMDGADSYPEMMKSLEKTMLVYEYRLHDIQKQLRGSMQQQKDEFLFSMCRGNINEKKVQEKLSKYEISLKNAPFEFMMFQYREIEESTFCVNGTVDYDLLLFVSQNVIEELLCKNGGAAFRHDRMILCICQPVEEADVLNQLLNQIVDFHKDVIHAELCVFRGGQGSELSDIPELFLNAEEMANYKTFWEKDIPNILDYRDSKSRKALEEDSISLDIQKRFLNLLSIKDYTNAYELLTEQLNMVEQGEIKNFQLERYKIYGLVSNLLEGIPHVDQLEKNSTEEARQIGEILESLSNVRSLQEIREKIDLLFEKIISYQKGTEKEGFPWVWEVQSYIEKNYADPQMDVQYLAEKFHLSTSHLSRNYKKVTSIGVRDNIHIVRIAKAKELLMQGMSVQEIAEKVGYVESRALIRTFKRYEGVTPGQYRETMVQK